MTEKNFFKLIDNKISSEVGEQIMSLGAQLREEGRKEGRLEGKREIALRMLEEGFESALVVKVTGLSLDQLRNIQNIKIVAIDSLQ